MEVVTLVVEVRMVATEGPWEDRGRASVAMGLLVVAQRRLVALRAAMEVLVLSE